MCVLSLFGKVFCKDQFDLADLSVIELFYILANCLVVLFIVERRSKFPGITADLSISIFSSIQYLIHLFQGSTVR